VAAEERVSPRVFGPGGKVARVNGEADLISFLRMISTAINAALATFSPAYPLSAKTGWMTARCGAKSAEAVRLNPLAGDPLWAER
jgi:hypothetical protein